MLFAAVKERSAKYADGHQLSIGFRRDGANSRPQGLPQENELPVDYGHGAYILPYMPDHPLVLDNSGRTPGSVGPTLYFGAGMFDESVAPVAPPPVYSPAIYSPGVYYHPVHQSCGNRSRAGNARYSIQAPVEPVMPRTADYTTQQAFSAAERQMGTTMPPIPAYGFPDGALGMTVEGSKGPSAYKITVPARYGSIPERTPAGSSEAKEVRKRKQGGTSGPIPAAPVEVRTDSNGVEWIMFDYSKKKIRSTYCIRCDIRTVDVKMLSDEFKADNCVYPRAIAPPGQYSGNRQHYETECNNIGWALTYLNPELRNHRGLIQRAVDSWRNSNIDPSRRSRRVRRMAKKQRLSIGVNSSELPSGMGSSQLLPGKLAPIPDQ